MQSSSTTQTRSSAPVLRGAPLVGAAFQVRRDYLGTIMQGRGGGR